MTSRFFNAPEPPYYAVIFSSLLSGEDADGYDAMHDHIYEIAITQPGYLGLETTRDEEGFGITVVYYDSAQAIENWGKHSEHKVAQNKGRESWYRGYRIRIAKVERESSFDR